MIDFQRRLARFSFRETPSAGATAESPVVEMRFVGSKAFFESTFLDLYAGDPQEPKPKPKPWLAMDWSVPNLSLDTLVFPFPFIDPARLLDAVGDVSGEVEDLGALEIRGVETHGYRLTIDLRRAIEKAPPKARPDLLQELERRELRTQPIEVWLDDENLARRVRLTTGEEEEVVTIDFFDFGIEVEVEAPPDDQVQPFGELVASSGSGGTSDYSELEPGDDQEVTPDEEDE